MAGIWANCNNFMEMNIVNRVLYDFGVRKTMIVTRKSFILENFEFWKYTFLCKNKNTLCAGFGVISNFPGPLVTNARNCNPKNSGSQNLSQNWCCFIRKISFWKRQGTKLNLGRDCCKLPRSSELGADGEPSTWLPSGGLVDQSRKK